MCGVRCFVCFFVHIYQQPGSNSLYHRLCIVFCYWAAITIIPFLYFILCTIIKTSATSSDASAQGRISLCLTKSSLFILPHHCILNFLRKKLPCQAVCGSPPQEYLPLVIAYIVCDVTRLNSYHHLYLFFQRLLFFFAFFTFTFNSCPPLLDELSYIATSSVFLLGSLCSPAPFVAIVLMPESWTCCAFLWTHPGFCFSLLCILS